MRCRSSTDLPVGDAPVNTCCASGISIRKSHLPSIPSIPEHAPSSQEHIPFFFGHAPTRADRGCTRYCQARTSRSLEKHRDCLPARSARRNQCVLAVLASQPAQESRAQLSRYGLCCDLAHSGRQQKRLPLQSRLHREDDGRWCARLGSHRLAAVVAILQPVAPKGCPSESEPPSVLKRSSGIDPTAE